MTPRDSPAERPLKFGEFTLDLQRRVLLRGPEPVRLTPKPFAVLAYLAQNGGRLISKDELLQTVWQGEHHGDNTVEQAIRKIRQALGDDDRQPKFIQTIPRLGYNFIAAIESPPAAASAPVRRDRLISRRVLIGSVFGVAGLAAGSAGFLRRAAAVPIKAGFVGNAVCAWDAMGAVIWKYIFPEPITTRLNVAEWPMPERRIQVVNFQGDGPQVLCAVSFGPPESGGRDELYCFSGVGRLLWHTPIRLSMRFGSDSFHGPWLISDMLAVASSPRQRVYIAGFHWMWRPGFVAEIGRGGELTLAFSHAGNLYSLCRSSSGYLLAGGINNEYNTASLAVLKDGAAPSRSPQTEGSRFECVSGPAGHPYRYFLLPPTEIAVASGIAYNQTGAILEAGSLLQISTQESPGDPSGSSPGNAIYRFSAALEPEDVTFDNSWAAVHQRLKSQGRIRHDLEKCDSLKGPISIRRWDPQAGWTTVQVPFASGIGPGAYQG
jgi:DNA-binding winged helix-turn-helix (wHTH) protein